MSEATLSVGELDFLKSTFELVLEEFEGIEEGRSDLDNYVLTTGALEDSRIAAALIGSLYERLHKEDFIDEEK